MVIQWNAEISRKIKPEISRVGFHSAFAAPPSLFDSGRLTILA